MPQYDLAFLERLWHVDDALVGRATKAQRDIIFLLHKGSVHEDVDAGQDAVGVGTVLGAAVDELVPGVSREEPYRLRAPFPPRPKRNSCPLEEVDETFLVLGFGGLPP